MQIRWKLYLTFAAMTVLLAIEVRETFVSSLEARSSANAIIKSQLVQDQALAITTAFAVDRGQTSGVAGGKQLSPAVADKLDQSRLEVSGNARSASEQGEPGSGRQAELSRLGRGGPASPDLCRLFIRCESAGRSRRALVCGSVSRHRGGRRCSQTHVGRWSWHDKLGACPCHGSASSGMGSERVRWAGTGHAQRHPFGRSRG